MGDSPGRLRNPLAERPATRPLVGCSAAPSASRAGREFPPPSSHALSATSLSRGPSAWHPGGSQPAPLSVWGRTAPRVKRRLAPAARPVSDSRQRPEDAGGRAAWALLLGTGDVGPAAAVEASAAAPQKTERCPATQPPAAASTPESVGGGVWKRRLRTHVRGRLGEKGGHPKCPSGDKGMSQTWSVYSLKKEGDSDTRPRVDEAERHYAP